MLLQVTQIYASIHAIPNLSCFAAQIRDHGNKMEHGLALLHFITAIKWHIAILDAIQIV